MVEKQLVLNTLSVIKHAKRMRCIIFLSLACLALLYLSLYFIKCVVIKNN